MSACPVTLQLLDGIHANLQNCLLLVERFHLLLNLLQFRLLRGKLLDAVILFGQLALPRKIDVAQHQAAEHHAGSNEDRRQGRPSIYRPPR